MFYNFIHTMSKLERLITYVLVTILVIIMLAFIPTIQRGQKLSKLNELWQVRQQCETMQLNAQTEAKKLREELGLSQPKPEAVTGTVIDQLNKAITLTWK